MKKNLFNDNFFEFMDSILNEAVNKESLFKNTSIVTKNLNLVTKKTTENENDYHLLLSLPGLTRNDLKISVSDGLIKVEYIPTEGVETLFVDEFSKSFKLPTNINVDGITAKVENGILDVTIPKKKKDNERSVPIL